MSPARKMNRQQAFEIIADELQRLRYVQSLEIALPEGGTLYKYAWDAAVKDFFDRVRNISWRQTKRSKYIELIKNDECFIVTSQYAFSANVVYRSYGTHFQTLRDYFASDLHGEYRPQSDEKFAENVVVLQISEIFFQKSEDVFSRTFGGRALSGFAVYDLKNSTLEFETNDGFYSHDSGYILHLVSS